MYKNFWAADITELSKIKIETGFFLKTDIYSINLFVFLFIIFPKC